MSRPRKQTVDWFPHYCNHGKTMFILEKKFGIAGYGFWFKLLEVLGNTEGHFIDINHLPAFEYLQAHTYTTPDTCLEILNLLASLEAIHPELWKNKIIWSDNFVVGLSPCYRNRAIETPVRPDFLRQKPHNNEGEPDNPRQKSVEEVEEESRLEPPLPPLPEILPPPRQPSADTPPPGETVEPPKKRSRKKADRQFSPYSQEFENFYQHYPNKKGGKEEAWAIWQRRLKNNKLPPTNYLMECLYRLTQDPDWMKEDGKYVPMITKFLNNGRWTDVDSLKSSGTPGPKPGQPDPNCPICRGTGIEEKEKAGRKVGMICRCRRVKK